ncbi:MAG: hypothetical protein A2Z42_03990, partial [Candidatus Woykebacteria bacterium RBG_19FT_COMBO_43_10]
MKNARPSYFVVTFGCQQNKADSERIAGAFESRGFTKSPSLEQADNVIINTCMVRQHAEDRVYGLMKHLTTLKEKNPNFELILTGCLVGAMVYDTSGKFRRLMRNRLPLVDEFLPIGEVGFDVPTRRESKTHAWVIISNGCNNFCSYCIVPFSRGREVSRHWQDIMAEIDELKSHGYREITMLGQNVNSYGADFVKEHLKGGKYLLPDGRTVLPVMVKMSMGRKRIPTLFPHLLEEVAKNGFEKVSFLSANPWDFSDELIEVIARNPNIDRYIHLPIQSGDDTILRKMNRWYTAVEYKKLVKKIRKKIPGVEIGTDIIVGFPGETERQFENTFKLAKEIGWSVAYIAMYSPRPHTASAKNHTD